MFNLVASEAVGSIAGAGSVTLDSNTLTAGADNTSKTFSGVMSGTGGFTKSGSGTLTLTGNNAIAGTGNALANVLRGNAAANTLSGGAGDEAPAQRTHHQHLQPRRAGDQPHRHPGLCLGQGGADRHRAPQGGLRRREAEDALPSLHDALH
mgnify:CR=1 FL=1